MQVLLKKNVEKLGEIGDIVDVKNGYARNFLLPRGYAVTVSESNLQMVEREKVRNKEVMAKHTEELKQLADRLTEASVTIPSKANEEGHLFGSVGAQQIADALASDGYQVSPRMIQLEEPIKEVGVYEIPIQLNADLAASCKVWVVGE